MRRLIRLSAPAALLGLGLWLLSGCLPIPAFEKTTRDENAARKVGDAKSGRPVRLGRATRDDVLRVLGTPYMESSDGRTLAYNWSVLNGIVVWPLCFYAHDVRGERTLVLRLDESGVLRSMEVLKMDQPVLQWNLPMVHPPLPKDLQEEQRQRQQQRTIQQNRAAPPATMRTRPQ